ncbi:SERPIN1 protein [Eimeria tenella]|uniref:Serpin n=2 Tax=Eimeria tenella TaxID=5802 RepID=Q564H2_EIMTE|nr:SERPIN1 protein [Eimeria tenella]ADV31341.1 serpin [Eimeria tenella]CAI72624.1 SERPIN1 protein precursor [Eimeria tenella]CDJ42085.1 SERPIN1 protein [Eimeria tenella]|eukprot:XP_013232835.1 SERPIN1 protein [Eimeria tenella]
MALLSKLKGVYLAFAIAGAFPFTSMTSAMERSTITAERLYGKIAGASIAAKPNFVFSPFSIFSVFHAAQKGAAGQTKAQMDALVGPNETFEIPELIQPPRKDGAVTVDVANRLYVHPGLENNKQFNKFKKQLEDEKHEAETIDFSDGAAAAEKINAFVATTTRDHIKNLVSPSALGAQTRLVLVNALYFKAPWLTQFSAAGTSKGVFSTPAGPKQVMFMRGKLDKAPLLVTMKKEFLAVGLPYSDARLRLYFFMPDDLASFEKAMVDDPQLIETAISDMESSANDRSFEEEMYLTVPKFKLSADDNKVDLTEIFGSMGATDMFRVDKADFSEMTGDRDLFVSSFVHQADIDVNEEGTEATAASAMIMMLRAMPMPKTPINVIIDKPFVFQLRFVDGDTNLTLFSGRVADPAAAQQ